MAEITIAGIMRAGAYSPNHIGNDAAIFNATADQLRKRGCTVNIYSEEQFNSGKVKERVILNMCREHESIKRLQDMEDDGCIVVNSGYGIENCTRERMTRILMGHNIPYPDSVIVNTDEAVVNQLRKAGINNCWIKRLPRNVTGRNAFARQKRNKPRCRARMVDWRNWRRKVENCKRKAVC